MSGAEARKHVYFVYFKSIVYARSYSAYISISVSEKRLFSLLHVKNRKCPTVITDADGTLVKRT